jgi:hypothetical protein
MKKFKLDYYFRLYYNINKSAFLFIISVIFIFSCGTALYLPSTENVLPNTNIEDLQKGRKLYINNCGSCHSLILPDKYNTEQWQFWVSKMEPKTKINSEDSELILKYLTKGKK